MENFKNLGLYKNQQSDVKLRKFRKNCLLKLKLYPPYIPL